MVSGYFLHSLGLGKISNAVYLRLARLHDDFHNCFPVDLVFSGGLPINQWEICAGNRLNFFQEDHFFSYD